MPAVSKYDIWKEKGELENILKLIKVWRMDGASLENIEKNLHISKKTRQNYEQKYPDFAAALAAGTEILNADVELSLYKLCKGYEYSEEQIVKVKLANGGEQLEVKRITKHMKPDVAAIIFTLRNRLPNKWKNNIPETGRNEQGEKQLEAMLTMLSDAKEQFASKKG